MTVRNENITEVQKRLLDLISDEGTKTILEAIIEKLNEEGDDSERVKQLYNEVRGYIPKDSGYNEKYWAAAYILYTNNTNWENFFDKDDDDEEYEDILKPRSRQAVYRVAETQRKEVR